MKTFSESRKIVHVPPDDQRFKSARDTVTVLSARKSHLVSSLIANHWWLAITWREWWERLTARAGINKNSKTPISTPLLTLLTPCSSSLVVMRRRALGSRLGKTQSNPRICKMKHYDFWGFFTQLHKLRSLRRSFLHFHFISAVHIWFISYIINTTHFFHGNIWTHNLPAPKVSGFIAQLVEHRTGIARSRVQTPLKSRIFFQASLRNCINCVH